MYSGLNTEIRTRIGMAKTFFFQEKIIADERNEFTSKENYCQGLDCVGGVVAYCVESWSLKEDIKLLEAWR